MVRPTVDGFTRVGGTPVSSVWLLGGGNSVPIQNVECYKPIALNNSFSAIAEAHINGDEKWPSLVESLAPPSQAEKRAQKAAFWIRSQKKGKGQEEQAQGRR